MIITGIIDGGGYGFLSLGSLEKLIWGQNDGTRKRMGDPVLDKSTCDSMERLGMERLNWGECWGSSRTMDHLLGCSITVEGSQ